MQKHAGLYDDNLEAKLETQGSQILLRDLKFPETWANIHRNHRNVYVMLNLPPQSFDYI